MQLCHILGAQSISRSVSSVINNNEEMWAGRGGVKEEGSLREFFLALD